MPSTRELAAILAEEVSELEREKMFVALWEVLMADGVRKASEEEVVEKVSAVFGIGSNRAMMLAANTLKSDTGE